MRGFRGLLVLVILSWATIIGNSYLIYHWLSPAKPNLACGGYVDCGEYERDREGPTYLKVTLYMCPEDPRCQRPIAQITANQPFDLSSSADPVAVVEPVTLYGDSPIQTIGNWSPVLVTLSDEDIARIAKAVTAEIKKREDALLVGRETGPIKNGSDFIHVLPVRPDRRAR